MMAPSGRDPAAGMKRRLPDLWVRLGSALVMAAAALGSLWLSGQAFLLFWLLAAVFVHWEWQHMVGGRQVLLRTLIGTAALSAAAAFARQSDADLPFVALLAGAAACAACAGPGRRVWAASGIAYAGALIVALCVLRFSNPAIYRHLAILWLFAIVWGTDVMAYFAGRLIGGPKLWPRVSPSKTWSGTLTGIACGALLGVATVKLLGQVAAPVNPFPLFLLGAVVAAAAQAGDMAESAMKRHFGVKDSGTMIPGHGGFMDRLDGFTAACVLAACVGAIRFGSNLAANGLFQW